MGDFRGRVEGTSDEAAAEVGRRLEAAEAPDSVARDLGLDGAGLVAALARLALGAEGSEGLPLVRGNPTRPRLASALSEDRLAPLSDRASRPARLALAAGLLQAFDAWEPSHHAAQEADDLGDGSTAAYWHLIAHRREPDPGNALYWARRVGPRHPIARPLAGLALPLIEAHDDPALAPRLLPDGAWSHPAMIELTTRARGPLAALARRLQRLEMIALLGASLEAAGMGDG